MKLKIEKKNSGFICQINFWRIVRFCALEHLFDSCLSKIIRGVGNYESIVLPVPAQCSAGAVISIGYRF